MDKLVQNLIFLGDPLDTREYEYLKRDFDTITTRYRILSAYPHLHNTVVF